MFKRFLMAWLILCTLGYGSVWALDGHVDEAAEHHKVFDDAGAAPEGEDGCTGCDHCCHAAAHIVALCPTAIVTPLPGTDTGFTPYTLQVQFQSSAPPDRPPQV